MYPATRNQETPMQHARIAGDSQQQRTFSTQPEVLIQLDRPQSNYYTNLDIVAGRILLTLTKPTAISSLTIKLKGESKSKLHAALSSPSHQVGQRVQEDHALLYRSVAVWPADGTIYHGQQQVLPGRYSFPFQLKIPFNNACIENAAHVATDFQGLFTGPGIANQRPVQHVKDTLPPSLRVGDVADISYHVKVTVTRPSLLNQNVRHLQTIQFLPIEPPREHSDGEYFVRRHHEFSNSGSAMAGDRRGSGFIDKLFGGGAAKRSADNSRTSSPTQQKPFDSALVDRKGTPSPGPAAAMGDSTYKISLEGRLPSSAVLTRGHNLPLRLFISQRSRRSPDHSLILQWLQIELVSHLKVRAQELTHTENQVIPVFSQANMDYPLIEALGSVDGGGSGGDVEIPDVFWNEFRLPEYMTPGFRTCNVANEHELLVKVGLEYRGVGGASHAQRIELPLRLAVKVLSGITPPPSLLARMRGTPGSTTNATSNVSNSQQQQMAPSLSSVYPVQPPRPGAISQSIEGQTTDPNLPGFEEPPPSYEDATAVDLPPIDGPRPNYQPPERTLTNPGVKRKSLTAKGDGGGHG